MSNGFCASGLATCNLQLKPYLFYWHVSIVGQLEFTESNAIHGSYIYAYRSTCPCTV